MERQLATTTLWQLQYIQYSMSQSAAHDEIHVADAADEWLAESQGNLAVFARRKFKAGLGFMDTYDIGLAINCCGAHTKTFKYRLRAKGKIEESNVPVTWAGGRMAALKLTLPYCVSAFVKKKSILVHCNQSFHRAPLGLAMLTRMLFGEEPDATMAHLASMRDIYYMYEPASQGKAASQDKARLYVKGNMPAAWAQTQGDTATEDDTA